MISPTWLSLIAGAMASPAAPISTPDDVARTALRFYQMGLDDRKVADANRSPALSRVVPS
ncbi:hypothetical protein GCM10010924_47780 [Rhizobium wenxiniae]|nr:hypothetical protein GCM10010924_47780 [Rhizobium wenxiniae]